jgi:two-component system, chemotaxis family, chemotaxis protein CheY
MNESGNMFYDEVMDKLQCMEDALLDVKNGVYDLENINEIFRSVHTVKGTADLLGMVEIVSITHKAEDLLDEVRADNVILDDKLCNLFLDLKRLLVVLVDQILNFIDIDTDTKNLLLNFEKEIYSYMPKDDPRQTILIIDDSRLIREKAKLIAQEGGYCTITSDDGYDGLEKLQNHNVDLVFADISTPLIGTIDMLHQVKKSKEYQELPIVMLSNEKSDSLFRVGKHIGAKAWLLKSFDKNKFLTVISKILN